LDLLRLDPVELAEDVAEREPLAVAQLAGGALHAIDAETVLAAEVADRPAAIVERKTRVATRDRGVRDHDVAVGRAPELVRRGFLQDPLQCRVFGQMDAE